MAAGGGSSAYVPCVAPFGAVRGAAAALKPGGLGRGAGAGALDRGRGSAGAGSWTPTAAPFARQPPMRAPVVADDLQCVPPPAQMMRHTVAWRRCDFLDVSLHRGVPCGDVRGADDGSDNVGMCVWRASRDESHQQGAEGSTLMYEEVRREATVQVPETGGARVLAFAERLAPAAAEGAAAMGHEDVNLHALTPTLLPDLAFQVQSCSEPLTRLNPSPACVARTPPLQLRCAAGARRVLFACVCPPQKGAGVRARAGVRRVCHGAIRAAHPAWPGAVAVARVRRQGDHPTFCSFSFPFGRRDSLGRRASLCSFRCSISDLSDMGFT